MYILAFKKNMRGLELLFAIIGLGGLMVVGTMWLSVLHTLFETLDFPIE